jgi:hypothetical protein
MSEIKVTKLNIDEKQPKEQSKKPFFTYTPNIFRLWSPLIVTAALIRYL